MNGMDLTWMLSDIAVALVCGATSGVFVAWWWNRREKDKDIERKIEDGVLELMFRGDTQLLHDNSLYTSDLWQWREKVLEPTQDEMTRLAKRNDKWLPSRWGNFFEVEFERRLRARNELFGNEQRRTYSHWDGLVDKFIYVSRDSRSYNRCMGKLKLMEKRMGWYADKLNEYL